MSELPPRTTHLVYLRGGLGNILFQLAMALRASRLEPGRVNVITSHTKALRDPMSQQLVEKLCSNLGFEIHHHPKKRHLLELSAHFLRGSKLVLERNYQTLPTTSSARSRSFVISGYFQSYELLREEIHEVANLIRDYLIATLGFSNELYGAIHVRLGDYRKFASTYGTLEGEYYERAYARVTKAVGSVLPVVYVFSDETHAAKHLLSKLPISVEFPKINKPESPVRDLWALSQASWILAPNSTFSWWAAQIGSGVRIAIPDPYLVDKRKNKRVKLMSPNAIQVGRF